MSKYIAEKLKKDNLILQQTIDEKLTEIDELRQQAVSEKTKVKIGEK